MARIKVFDKTTGQWVYADKLHRVDNKMLVDKTLTISDMAADAKTVGDMRASINTRINNLASLSEGSTTGDAELIDARVDCEGKTWSNVGGHVRGITEKIIDACCDKEIISSGNYNLFKMSEVMYSTRLQDDVEGTTSSTKNNFVTGWIPVKYGKYYGVSILWDGNRVSAPNIGYVRMNLKRQDGTIVVYNKGQVPTVLEHSKRVLNLLYEDVIAIRLHMGVSTDGQNGVDVSTPDKLGAYQVMFVEGDTPEQAYLNALNFEYLDGDAEVPAEIGYTIKRDYSTIELLEKVIEACCDEEIISGGNYNLLKLNEITFQSRLDNTSTEIISSTANNLVTGWFPVTPGKYYVVSGYRDDIDARCTYSIVVQRVQLKLADGSIKVYTNEAGGNKYPVTEIKEYDGNLNAFVYGIDDENAVAMRLHLSKPDDISTAAKFEVFKPMITEGKTQKEAIDKSLYSEYISGDKYIQAEIEYKLKRDYTKADKLSVDSYYRDINFGIIPFNYYQGQSDSYAITGFNKNTKYADFIAEWKSLITNHGGYVTETELGKASDNQSIYLYNFKPARILNQNKPIPKIIIIAGQHGFEKSNVFGLYHFVGNLLNNWTEHPALEYLRNNVELMIIPVLNTYGFDSLQYKNANGVNTNRNYDSLWSLVEDTTSPQYGGAEPFDQPETQIVRDLIIANADALLVIDFHTNGGGCVNDYSDVNWCGLCSTVSSYYNRMKDAVAHHLAALTAHFNVDYELNQPNVMMGNMTTTDGIGLLRNWTTDNNIIGVLVEGFNGFPGGTEFTNDVFKANEEILVNYLITALNYLEK